MRSRSDRARTAAAILALTLIAALAGCGGSGGGASKKDYYAAINGFCGKVTAAAKQVSTVTQRVQKDTTAPRSVRLQAVTTSLTQFADSTETALNTLQKAGVPATFKAYQAGTATGFESFIAALRKTASESTKTPSVLTQLQSRLNAVKLPDPPKDITANAKSCAEFTPAGG